MCTKQKAALCGIFLSSASVSVVTLSCDKRHGFLSWLCSSPIRLSRFCPPPVRLSRSFGPPMRLSRSFRPPVRLSSFAVLSVARCARGLQLCRLATRCAGSGTSCWMVTDSDVSIAVRKNHGFCIYMQRLPKPGFFKKKPTRLGFLGFIGNFWVLLGCGAPHTT